MGVVKCIYAEDGECDASTGCAPFIEGRHCPRLEDGFLRGFEPARQIAIIWDIVDVQFLREDLTEEQAMKVLEEVCESHDANYGVNWETLDDMADSWFPKNNNAEVG